MTRNEIEANQGMYSLLLLMVAIMWGSGFVATQICVNEGYSSSFIMLNRFGVATIVLLVLFLKEMKKITKKDFISGVIVGVFLFAGFYLLTLGIRYTTPSNNAFLVATSVMIVPFIYWIIAGKRPTFKTILSILIGLAGVATLSLEFGHGMEGIGVSKGDLISVCAAFFFACHLTSVGHFGPKVGTRKLMILQVSTATVLSFIVFLFTDGSLEGYTNYRGVLSVIYMGVVITSIAFTLQAYVQRFVIPTKAALILTTEAVFASLFSIVLRFEKATISLLIGGTLIFCSILIMEVNWRKLFKS